MNKAIKGVSVFGVALVFSLFALSATGAEESLHGLSSSELDKLAKGEAVIRSVPDYRKLALSVAGSDADELRSSVASVHPNYTTEVIATFPVVDDEAASALMARLVALLADPKGYVGIPFWSKRQQKTYDLFDKMDVSSRKPTAGGEEIVATQHMEPFDAFQARYEYSLKGAALRFSAKNLGPIIYSYQKFKAVTPGNMLWSLYAFRDGDRVVFYGVGAVKAFDLFGAFRDRLETSFMGRVEAFFGYMSKKMRSDE